MLDPTVCQYVHFGYYQIDRAWQAQSAEIRKAEREEFLEMLEAFSPPVFSKSYSTGGLHKEVDFFLWQVADQLPDLEHETAALKKTALGRALKLAGSSISMTTLFVYGGGGMRSTEGQQATEWTLGSAKYLFVYPVRYSREWRNLSEPDKRPRTEELKTLQEKYPSVKLHETYSMEMLDQDFVIALAGDQPIPIVRFLKDLRNSRYASYFENAGLAPIWGIEKPLPEILGEGKSSLLPGDEASDK